MATFTKLKNGDWGVKVNGSASPGQQVTVDKKSGGTKTVKIAKVLWSGNGVSICAIEQRQTAGSRTYDNKTERDSGGVYCGYNCPVSGLKCCAKNGPCHDCQ